MISNASIMVLAGSETTATPLTDCMWLLLKNPDCLGKLERHVRSSFRSEDEIYLLSVGNLGYMFAVFDHALRLYPPPLGQSNKAMIKGGAIVAGQWV